LVVNDDQSENDLYQKTSPPPIYMVRVVDTSMNLSCFVLGWLFHLLQEAREREKKRQRGEREGRNEKKGEERGSVCNARLAS
jgi:hypothetical protein